jgi:hypothetical protein
MQKDTKNLFLNRQKALQSFNKWGKKHPAQLSPQSAVEGLDFLYKLLPEESRHRPIDPSGIMIMHRALAHLKDDYKCNH